jgi:hypothetical protein
MSQCIAATSLETKTRLRGWGFHRAIVWEAAMRSILLYFLGVPIPIILLLAMCSHHF